MVGTFSIKKSIVISIGVITFPTCLHFLIRCIQFPTLRAGSRGIESLGSVSYMPMFVNSVVLKIKRARATITVTTIFRDFIHSPSNRVYRGGNPEYINPVEIADTERKSIWPDTEHYPHDIIISIGAGIAASPGRPLRRVSIWRLKSGSDDRVVLDPSESTSNAQDIWDHYKDSLPNNARDGIRYVRLNVPLHCPVPRLDDVDEMKPFQKQVRSILREVNFASLARQLIASCFFFDIVQPPAEAENGALLSKGDCWTLMR
jgi:hypothetical protein